MEMKGVWREVVSIDGEGAIEMDVSIRDPVYT